MNPTSTKEVSWEEVERFERVYNTSGDEVGEVWELARQEGGDEVRAVYAQKSGTVWRVARCRYHGDATDRYYRTKSAIRTDSLEAVDSAEQVNYRVSHNLIKWRRGH